MQDHVRPCSGVTEALAVPQARLIYKVRLTAKCAQAWSRQNQILGVLVFRQGAQVFNVQAWVGLRMKSEQHSFQKRGWKFTWSNCVWHIKTMSQDLAATKQRLTGRSCCRAENGQELWKLELHLCSKSSCLLQCCPLQIPSACPVFSSLSGGDKGTPEMKESTPWVQGLAWILRTLVLRGKSFKSRTQEKVASSPLVTVSDTGWLVGRNP